MKKPLFILLLIVIAAPVCAAQSLKLGVLLIEDSVPFYLAEKERFFVDENLEEIDFDDPVDVVAISMMLTVQVKRGWAIADHYRAKGIPVIFGGIATMLHAQETRAHADAVFLGEAEGRMTQLFSDSRAGPSPNRPRMSTTGTSRPRMLIRPRTWSEAPGRVEMPVAPTISWILRISRPYSSAPSRNERYLPA